MPDTEVQFSLYDKSSPEKTIEELVHQKFSRYIGKSDIEIQKSNGWTIGHKSKQFQRLLTNKILTDSIHGQAIEFKKSNVVLKVVTLEHTGTLRESLSFPAFKYNEIVYESWDNLEDVPYSKLHNLLETKKFLFVVFQKVKNSQNVIFKKYLFWNFPESDMSLARSVFEHAKLKVIAGDYANLPKISDNAVAHVRPHGKNASDKIATPQGGLELKRCFWLNAKYIQKVLDGATI
jgi:DNA mismatch repair protein MutH